MARNVAPRRDWRPVVVEPALADGLVLFDGVCEMCSRWVLFAAAHDHRQRLRFLPIQSDAGRALAQQFGLTPDDPQTNVVILSGRAYFKSDAALAVLRVLPAWRWLGVLRLFPRSLRDVIYDVVARNRYRWFGRRDVCLAPSSEIRARIVLAP
jgi:predicted DCC family thiol-disulfide oxidoreductase YuxK